jgi:hypothetical protein
MKVCVASGETPLDAVIASV